MRKDCAIAVYIDNDSVLFDEVGWLHNSWVRSNANERSDILIFYNPEINANVLPSGEGVIHIPLEPINKKDELWKDYPRINSTYYLTTKEAEIIKNYVYTLRTDCDCFLTRNFVTFRPRLATFGINEYASRDMSVARRIMDICERKGIRQYFINSDCHVMCYSNMMLQYARIQYQIARELKTQEFKDGHGEWPGWYEYIINMYSAGIAANKLFGNGFKLGGIGCMSMSHEPIAPDDYHIHAFHTNQHFSKHKWREGYYDCLDFNALDPNIIVNYCIIMAGKRNQQKNSNQEAVYENSSLCTVLA